MKLKFDIKGLEPVLKKLNSLKNNLEKFKPVFAKIAHFEIEDAKKRIISTKKDPNNKPWDDWAISTRLARIREGTASKGILYRSGNLAQSFGSNINNTQAIIYNKAPYAHYLQYGTDKMPSREFLGWSKESKQRMTQITKEHLGIK